MSGERKRKAKAFYKKSAKVFRPNDKVLSPNIKGFICTCNNTERQCVREAYNILNEVADNVYGKESGEVEEKEEIEENLDAELTSLREASKKPKRRFQVIDSGAKNLVFIKTEVDSPTELLKKVFDHIKESGEQKTRYLLRMLPVEATCKAAIEDIKKQLDPLIEKHFSDAKNFHIQVIARNSNIKRDHILPELLSLFKLKFPNLTGCLVHPHKSLIIQIIKNTACLCIIEDYDLNAKCNLLELAERHKKEVSSEPCIPLVSGDEATSKKEMEEVVPHNEEAKIEQQVEKQTVPQEEV